MIRLGGAAPEDRWLPDLLANWENDKFSQFEGRESDQEDEAAIVDVILRHHGAVALCTTAPQVGS